MEPLETAVRGAKIQSFRKSSPRDVLRRIISEEPDASKSQLLTMCRDEILKDEDMVESVIEYWFSNNYHSLIGPTARPTSFSSRQLRESRIETAKTAIVERIEERAQMILLDMIMPNGKALKECSGKECASLGKRISPWLARISKAVPPSKLVGDVLSEERVRQIYQMRSNS
jgi:hypothetical protein